MRISYGGIANPSRFNLHLFWCSDLSLTYLYKQSCIKAKYMAANICCILRHLSLSQNFCNPINQILLFGNSNAKKEKEKRKETGVWKLGKNFLKNMSTHVFQLIVHLKTRSCYRPKSIKIYLYTGDQIL